VRRARLQPHTSSLDTELILARLDEMEKRVEKLMRQVMKEKTNKSEEISRNEVTIIKGQMNKAENTIEKWLEQLTGNVIAQLDFIDKTTFGYLDSIPKNCGIRIITSNVKEVEKCILKADKCARGRPYLEIVEIDKIHQRWIGSEESFFIDIGTDLKSDALGHSTHTIRKLPPESFKKSMSNFEQLWSKSEEELRRIYGHEICKSMVYQSPRAM
jgi:hypothetical protein